MDKIAEAEAVLRNKHTHGQLAHACAALIALAKEQRDELARLTKGVEAARREMDRECKTGSQGVGYNDGVRWCLAILDQVSVPAQEVE